MDCSILKFYNYEKHPKYMGKAEIEQFLSYLAVERKISAATQQQATTAIVFLFREVLHINIDDKIQPIKAQKRTTLPVVMSRTEIYLHLLDTKMNVKSPLDYINS